MVRLFLLSALLAVTFFAHEALTQVDAPCPDSALPDKFDFSLSARFVGKEQSLASEKNGRIAGGEVTTPNEFPWQALIRVFFWSGGSAVCGGSLISDQWILTAAHCSYGVVNMTVILGAHDITDGSSDKNRVEFNINIREIINYNGWFYGDLEGDISLVKLPSRVTFNQYIQPIKLPYSDDPSFEGSPVIITGWGNYSSTVDSGLSPQLRKALTTVTSTTSCRTQSGQNFNGDRIICGDGTQSKRFCFGDDGGPMNYYRTEEATDYWVLVGVATSGDSSAGCVSSTKPSLYTRVSYYLDWIHGNTDIPPAVRPTTTSSTSTTTTRTPTTKDPNAFDCEGKPDGRYPVPNQTCSKFFYICANELPYLFECAQAGTVFDVTQCQCDFPENVGECRN